MWEPATTQLLLPSPSVCIGWSAGGGRLALVGGRGPGGRVNNILGLELHPLSGGGVVFVNIGRYGGQIQALGNAQVGAAGMQIQQLTRCVRSEVGQNPGQTQFGLEIQKNAAQARHHNVRGPGLGLDAEQLEFDRQEFGLLPGLGDIGVNAVDESGDDLLALGMVVVHIQAQVAPGLQQARANITVERLGALNLGHGTGDPTTPDFELEQTVAGRVIALGKEQVVLVAGVDMGDAPAVGQDFDRFVEAGHLHPSRLLLGSEGGEREAENDGKEAHDNDSDTTRFHFLCSRSNMRMWSAAELSQLLGECLRQRSAASCRCGSIPHSDGESASAFL